MTILSKSRFVYVAIGFCLLSMGACMAPSIVMDKSVSLLPGDREIDGWMKSGPEIQCRNLEELARQINGGAPFYIDRGTKAVIFQDYTREGIAALLTLEIYRLENGAQAETLMNDIYVEDPVSLAAIGGKARLAASLIGVYVIDFIKDNFYLRVTITEKSSGTRKDVEQFAVLMSHKIGQ